MTLLILLQSNYYKLNFSPDVGTNGTTRQKSINFEMRFYVFTSFYGSLVENGVLLG